MHMHSLDSPTVSHNVLLPAGPWPSCAWQLLRFSPFPVGHPMSAGCNVTPHRRIASIHPFPPCVPPINTRPMTPTRACVMRHGIRFRSDGRSRRQSPLASFVAAAPPTPLLRAAPAPLSLSFHGQTLSGPRAKKSPSANATSVEFLEIVDWGVELFRVW